MSFVPLPSAQALIPDAIQVASFERSTAGHADNWVTDDPARFTFSEVSGVEQDYALRIRRAGVVGVQPWINEVNLATAPIDLTEWPLTPQSDGSIQSPDGTKLELSFQFRRLGDWPLGSARFVLATSNDFPAASQNMEVGSVALTQAMFAIGDAWTLIRLDIDNSNATNPPNVNAVYAIHFSFNHISGTPAFAWELDDIRLHLDRNKQWEPLSDPTKGWTRTTDATKGTGPFD